MDKKTTTTTITATAAAHEKGIKPGKKYTFYAEKTNEKEIEQEINENFKRKRCESEKESERDGGELAAAVVVVDVGVFRQIVRLPHLVHENSQATLVLRILHPHTGTRRKKHTKRTQHTNLMQCWRCNNNATSWDSRARELNDDEWLKNKKKYERFNSNSFRCIQSNPKDQFRKSEQRWREEAAMPLP